MKAAQIKKYGGKEVVEINNKTPKPEVSAGKILVEVHAASVNPADWKMREGFFAQMIPLKFPATLGGDFSGVVAEVGEGVSDFKKGDQVYGQAHALSGNSGTLAEFALTGAKTVSQKPEKLSHIEAAAIPLAGVSAWQALVDHMNLESGQKILIHGGAGGIGSFAIQIAKNIGAYIATTASAKDTDYVKKLGADKVIDYQKEKFEDLISGYDAVFDTVGGETYRKSFQVLRKGGIIVSMLEAPSEELMKQYGVKAISQFTQVTSERLAALAKLVDEGVLKVHVDKIFPLDQAGEALEYLKNGKPTGKVVVGVK